MEKLLTIILGPTAVGKTAYAINLAKQIGSPVINCDSRQIFKEMTIGTAVPSKEQLEEVKHYFIQTKSITEHYAAGQYEIDALALLDELFKKCDHLVMCGGSGLYIDAVCNGLDAFPEPDMELRDSLNRRLQQEGIESLRYQLKQLDPESYCKLDIANPQRIIRALEVTLQTGRKFSDWKTEPSKRRPFRIEKTGLTMDREKLYGRINARVDKMMEDGTVIDEELIEKLKAIAELSADKDAMNNIADVKMMAAAAGMLETTEMYKEIAQIAELYNMDEELALSMDEDGAYVEITIPGSILFQSGSATLREECKPLLSKVGDILKLYPDNYVDVIGHTDNIPINNASFSSNDILSSARAISAAQFIVKNNGIDVTRIGWTGRGEYEPVDTNETSEGRAKNSRVEIRLYNSYNSK